MDISDQKNKSVIPHISIINKPSSLLFDGCLLFYSKRFLRSLFRIQRGPDVVLKSLIRGLQLFSDNDKVVFNVNPTRRKLHKVVHVLSNPAALAWAIQQKQKGIIDKIIAGPNISILPSSDNRIYEHPEIDLILLPSEWTEEAYLKDSPGLSQKIKIWPSGVEIPDDTNPTINKQNSQKDFFLIFKKTYPEESYDQIANILARKDIPFRTLIYGKFNQNDYFKLLAQSKGMIYLQKAESQGIALQEAWARNVPTLVWNARQYTYDGTNITVDGKIGAPYLDDKSGMFFTSLEEFESKFDEFNNKIDTFTARDYCIKNLSDESTTKRYIEHILNIL